MVVTDPVIVHKIASEFVANFKEIAGVQLYGELIAGQEYLVEFKASLADNLVASNDKKAHFIANCIEASIVKDLLRIGLPYPVLPMIT